MGKTNILYLIITIVVLISILIPYSSAGILEWINKTITGKATSSVDTNITVGAGGGNPPNVTLVFNYSAIGQALNEGPASTNFTVNFTVLDLDGVSNLVNAT